MLPSVSTITAVAGVNLKVLFRKKRKLKTKNHTHVKNVGPYSEFLFGIYWWTWKTTIYLKNHTHVKVGAHLKISVWHLIDEQLFNKKLGTNKTGQQKCKNFNIYNIV